MNVIHKAILFLLLVGTSPLIAQNDLPFGFRKQEMVINTFVWKVTDAGFGSQSASTADGGFITTSRLGGTTFLVRKITASGQKQWERRLSFDINAAIPLARINGVTQTKDGGFVLAGQTGCYLSDCSSNPLPSGATLVKLQSNGTLSWKKSFSFPGVDGYVFVSVTPTSDGGVIATGTLEENSFHQFTSIFILRIASTGVIVWEKKLEGFPEAQRYLMKSIATPDNGLVVAFPKSLGVRLDPKGVYVMKITSSGNVLWSESLRVDGFLFQSMGATADSGVILAGTIANSRSLKVIVLKADGTLHWKATYPLKGTGASITVSSPKQTLDAGYVLTGGIYNAQTKTTSGFIAKIDSNHKIAFQNNFGGGYDYGESIFTTTEGGYVLFGSGVEGSESIVLILRTNSEGMVPGCNFFQPFEKTAHTLFGPLEIVKEKLTKSNPLPFVFFDFGVTSVVTDHSVSTVCQ